MKKRITTILLTFAIAITGINTPADKANAETSEAKTTAESTSETPSETTVPTATKTPSATPIPGCRIGAVVYDVNGQKTINTEEGPKPYTDELYFSYWPLPTQMPTATPAPTRTPVIGEYRGNNQPYDTEIYTENGWKKVEWKIGDCWAGRLWYTSTGWKPDSPEVSKEINEARMAAEAAEAAKKPHDIRIGKIDYSREEKTTRVDDGGTVEVTKDFSIEISFQAKGNASLNWTSSNPEVVTVTNIRQNGDKKTAVLNGKNYGSSVITMECNGYKASITANVMKNEYKGTCFGLRTDTFSGKNKGLSHKGENFAEVKYNSKGNLVIKYTHKTHKWKNRKEKRKIVYKGRSHVTINEIKGKSKRVLNRYCGKFKITVSPKKPNATFTITIPKKYLKKTLDLRYCSYGVGITGKYCKEYVKKAK